MDLRLIYKYKIRSDNYVSILMVMGFVIYFLFFTLEAILSLIVYPLTSLFVSGVLRIIDGLNKKKNEGYIKINQILIGTIYILFSVSFLIFILSFPGVTFHLILALIAFPMIFFGFAGIIKGLIVDIYSSTQRVINIIIGFITLIICYTAFTSNENNFLFNVISLFIIIILNVLCRAALYLSEYGLSLRHLRNFKLFLYIISDYIISVDRNGNIILDKIA